MAHRAASEANEVLTLGGAAAYSGVAPSGPFIGGAMAKKLKKVSGKPVAKRKVRGTIKDLTVSRKDAALIRGKQKLPGERFITDNRGG
jgi:hypothetical protein